MTAESLHTLSMSDQIGTLTGFRDDAWWRRELVRVGPEAKRWLGNRYPSMRHLHDDLVGEMVVQLTAYLNEKPETVPSSWFNVDGPPENERWRFQGFARTVLKRRVMDHFRSEFRAWTVELAEDLDPIEKDNTAHPSNHSDVGFELSRTARELLAMLAELPDLDRLLMEELALGGRDSPLTPAERQRVSRLRRQLLKELQKKLGRDPIELLKHL
jgi:hypothetical protein